MRRIARNGRPRGKRPSERLARVRERIQKLISEYGYKTPTQRQAARAGRGVYRIGVILPSWDAFFIRRMRDGIRVAVHNRGLNDVNVLVELKNRSHRAYFEAIGRMEERGIDGLIVTAPDTLVMREEIDRLVASGVPVVTCDSDVRAEPPPVSYRTEHGQTRPDCRRTASHRTLRDRMCSSLPATVNSRRTDCVCAASLTACTRFFDDNVNVNVIESVEKYELTMTACCTAAGAAEPASARHLHGERVRARLHGRARARKAQSAHSRLVCHDLTPHARQYLEDGRLDFIVDQDFFGADDARDRSAGAYTAYRRIAAAEHRIHSHQHYHGNCCEKGAYMKANWKRTLLSLVLCAGFDGLQAR